MKPTSGVRPGLRRACGGPVVCKQAFDRMLLGALVAALVAVALLWNGCDQDCTRAGPESPFLARTSPENLIHNLIEAYRYREVAEIDSLLAPDFVFYFSLYDQGNPQIPDSWGRSEEVRAHAGMFDPELVPSLDIDLVMGAAAYDPDSSTAGDSVWAAEVSNLDLELYGTPRARPEDPPAWYKVLDTRATFWFRRAGWQDPATGRPVWVISRCREEDGDSFLRFGHACPPDVMTWGRVKALYE